MAEQYPTLEEEMAELVERVRTSLTSLERLVSEGRKPPPGPYPFFHHTSHTHQRVRDCDKILGRLMDGRRRLTELGLEEHRHRPPDDPPVDTPTPERLEVVRRESSTTNGLMQLDMESLYFFGGVLLDQLALVALSVGGIKTKRRDPFVEFMNALESNTGEALQPIWDRLGSEVLWLHFQMRFYRNKFIVHGNRPWQRGTHFSVVGEDFQLSTPTPPGWDDDEALDREIMELLPLAPKAIQELPKDHWIRVRPGALLERVFDNIGNIESVDDRRRVAQLFSRKGGTTPTFQALARRLLNFVTDTCDMLHAIASEDLERVDLGQPHSTSEEMVARLEERRSSEEE